MYTDEYEEKRRFPVRAVLVKMVIIIVLIMLLMWILPISIFNGNKKIMDEHINSMKDAALSYYTDEKLPVEVGDESKITLNKMIELKLIDELKDKSDKACSSKNSYVAIKKQDKDYLMTIHLECGSDKKTKEITVNNYDYCETTLCEKQENNDNLPTCSLSVSEGELGVNDWYRSNVTVKLNKKTPSKDAKITEYGIGLKKDYNKKAEYLVKDDGTITVYGYVKDSKGKENTCSITIKKDTKKPTCNLTVLNGSQNSSGIYTSDIELGFATKTDELSGIDIYGISDTKEQLYNSDDKTTITKDGSYTLYGHVKDKAGNTNNCKISITRKAGTSSTNTGASSSNSNSSTSNKSTNNALSCKLAIHSGTKDKSGNYTSNVVVKFKNISTTNGIKVTGYGIGKSATYSKNNSYKVTTNGTHTIYGYVKDANGNTTKCSIQIKVKKPTSTYQYAKTIPAKYSAWSAWTQVKYDSANPPQFYKTDVKQVEDLGKKTTNTYKYSVGSAIYLNQLTKINTLTEQVCKGYDYYRVSSQTYAVKNNQAWVYQGQVTINTTPKETVSTKYVFDKLDWNCGSCTTPNIIWKKYTRETLTVVDKDTLKSSNGKTTNCSSLETGQVTVFNNYKKIVAFNQTRTTISTTAYYYRYRSRTLLQSAYIDYKYSTSASDSNLLKDGYKLIKKVTTK